VPLGLKLDPGRRRRSQKRPRKQQHHQQQQQHLYGQPAAAQQVEEEDTLAPQVCECTPLPANVAASQAAAASKPRNTTPIVECDDASLAEDGQMRKPGKDQHTEGGQAKSMLNGSMGLFRVSGEVSTADMKIRRTRLQRFTGSQTYEWLSFLLTMANAVFIGYQTESQAQRLMECGKLCYEPLLTLFFSCVFTVLFTLEVGVLWYVEGFFGFFQSSDVNFRVIDVVVVVVSIADSVVGVVNWTQRSDPDLLWSSLSALRIVRVLRVAKLARVIRVMTFFRELRLMVNSILSCVKPLLWVTIIFFITFYFFAITLTTGVVSHMADDRLSSDPMKESLRDYFGTLGNSLLTLYMAIAGGRDWGDFYHMLEPVALPYRMLFLVFLTFTLFALFNVVTGVFVDAATLASQNNHQMIIDEELRVKRRYLKTLREMFQRMDTDGDGSITSSEFTASLGDECVVANFRALKLDAHDAVNLFKLLDMDQSGSINVDEFLEGCYELQGETRNIDAKIMKMQLAWLVEQFEASRQLRRP